MAARGASLVFVTRILGAGLSLVIHVLLARWGGATVYGTYSYAVAWISTLSILVGLGFPEASLRFIPTYLQTENWNPLYGIVQRGERLTLLVSLVMSLAVTSGIWFLPFVPTGRTTQALLIAFWALPFTALVRYYTEACRAVDQIATAYVAPRLLRPGIMIVGIAALWTLPNWALTGPTVTALFGVAYLPIFIIQRKTFRRYVSNRSPADTSPQFETRRWLRVAFPLLLVTGFTTLLRKTDVLLVGWMLNMRAAGIYQAAVTVAAPVSFVLSAVNAVAAPRFARLHANQEKEKLRDFVRTLAHWLFWPSLGFSLLIAAGSPFFLRIFGSEFDTARMPLFLLIFSHLINAASGSVGYLLNMTGHHVDSARVYGVTVVVQILLTLVGIRAFGLMGAAIATAASTLIWNSWLLSVVKARLELSPSIISVLTSSD